MELLTAQERVESSIHFAVYKLMLPHPARTTIVTSNRTTTGRSLRARDGRLPPDTATCQNG